MKKLNLQYIPCRCYCAEHFVRVQPDEDVNNSLIVEIISSRNGSIWQRARWAFQHVFGRDDLVFADLIIAKDDWDAAGREALAAAEGRDA